MGSSKEYESPNTQNNSPPWSYHRKRVNEQQQQRKKNIIGQTALLSNPFYLMGWIVTFTLTFFSAKSTVCILKQINSYLYYLSFIKRLIFFFKGARQKYNTSSPKFE